MACWRATPPLESPPRRRRARRMAGSPAPRLDLPDKVFGRPRFVHQLALPGMLHGRVLKPASPGAKLESLDEGAVRAIAGVVAVVRDGSFVGVVAETEAAAEAALVALRKAATWGPGYGLPDETKLAAWLRSEPAETTTVDERKAAAPAAGCPHHPPPVFAALHRARLDGAVVRDRAMDRRRTRWRSGRTARASTACGSTCRWRWDCRRRASSCSISRAPAAMATTAPTTWPSTRCCWRAPPAGARCACNGRARTSLPGRRWAPPWPSRSRPTSTRRAKSSTGAGRCGATATCRGPGRAPIPTVLAASHLAKPFERFIAFNPPMAMGGGAERNAVPLYDLPALQGHLPPAADHADPHLGAAHARGLSPTCSRSSPSWTSWRPSAARTRLAFRLRHLKDPRARAVLGGCRPACGMEHVAQARGCGPRHRLRPLQELRHLLCGGGGGGGRRRHPRAPAGGRGRRGRGHQSRTAWPTRWRAAPSRPPAGR